MVFGTVAESCLAVDRERKYTDGGGKKSCQLYHKMCVKMRRGENLCYFRSKNYWIIVDTD